MPTYDYECDACGHKYELFQSMSEEPLSKCPQCKKKKLRRLFGAGAVLMFKGSGFYQTDYRSESYKKSAAAEKKSNEPAPSTSETKSESKSSEGKPAAETKPAPESKPAAPSKPDKKK